MYYSALTRNSNMNLIDLNLDFVCKEEYLSTFIDYLMKTSGKSIKANLKEMDLPSSSYNYCKLNGFLNSYSTKSIIENHFNSSLSINPELLKKLESLMSRSFTECVYVDGNTKNLRTELYELEEQCKNTILWPIYALVYIMILDLPDQIEVYKKLLPEEFIPLIEKMLISFPYDYQYIYYDMLSQYYMVTHELDKLRELVKNLEFLDNLVDERLKTIAYYDLMTCHYLFQNKETTLHYLLEGEQLCVKYFNPRRLKYYKSSKTMVLFLCKRYDATVISARNDLIFNSREENQPIIFKSTICVYLSSLYMLKRYNEVVKEVDLFYENEFTDFYIRGEMYRMLAYAKLKNKEQYENSMNKAVELSNKEGDGYVLIGLIHDLVNSKKTNLKTFGERLKPIKANPYNYFGHIVSILLVEYEEYLKANGKYVDLLDM